MVDGDTQVTAWLRGAGLSRFAPRFASALVSPRSFLQLSSSDLDALGVDSPADRKRLSDLILDLRRLSPSFSSQLQAANATNTRSRSVFNSLLERNTCVNPSLQPTSSEKLRPDTQQSFSVRVKPMATTTRTELGATVTVCVRKRPLSRKEVSSGDGDIITVSQSDASLAVHELKEKVDLTKYVETHPFSFDHVFGEHVGNAVVYDSTARPLVDNLFSGGRATCFAYGQTGAGKTFTMAGDGIENPGLYNLAVRDVFDRIREQEREAWRKADEDGIDDFEPPDPPQVWISFYEIYASRLQDLLNEGAKLECREDSNNQVQIVGLSERLCEVEEDVLALIREGSTYRSTGVTGANDDSSRSHAVFQIELREPLPPDSVHDQNTLVRNDILRAASGAVQTDDERKGLEIGRLCFIDLAGSERGSDTAASNRQTRMEGAEINKSLLALKECIRAMDKKKDHTPFRGSKLTQVLKASFLGKNCRTVMIANISPASSNVEHTLNTLRYSDRVKELRRDRGNTVSAIEGKLGARRATYAHGFGARNSSNGNPLALTSRANTLHRSDLSDEGNGTLNASRRPDRTHSFSGGSDADAVVSSQSRTRTVGTRRTSRIRVRVSEFPLSSTQSILPRNERKSNGKAHDGRFVRPSTSKVRDRVPPRPSLANTMLPRIPSKANVERTVVRSSSLARILSSVDVDSSTDDLDKLTIKSRQNSPESQIVQIDKHSSSPALTRRRARELEARRVEKQQLVSSEFQNDPLEHTIQNESKAKHGRRRMPRVSNVAESAVKFYKVKRKELDDEDLLYASSDDLSDDLTNVLNSTKSRQDGEKDNRQDSVLINGGNKDCSLGDGDSNRSQGRIKSGSGSESETNCNVKDYVKSSLSTKAQQVVRMHNMQIEELVRLTEADVALVQAIEKGEMDVQEYAMKLSVNLSQKLDIVRKLQTKLKILE